MQDVRHILSTGAICGDLPASPPLLLGDSVCLIVVEVESPPVSIVQLIVLIQQFVKCVQP